MRYIVGFLIVIGLIVLVFVLFLTGGSSTPKTTANSLTRFANTSTVMKLTIDGPITADLTHRSVAITIGESDATIDIIQGYQDTVINHASYVNNPTAYKNFLRALDLANFTKTRKTSITSETGVCATGDRNIYEIIDGATDLQRTWNTTCSGFGTFGGSPIPVINLFEKQIPDFSKLTENVNLGVSRAF